MAGTMQEISVPCSKYAHLCCGYMTIEDERIIKTREGNVFGVQLDQLKSIGESWNGPDGELEYILIVIPLISIFSKAVQPRLQAARLSASFITALQLCALSGVDMVRFSTVGNAIPGINKVRSDTDSDFYGNPESLTSGDDDDSIDEEENNDFEEEQEEEQQ